MNDFAEPTTTENTLNIKLGTTESKSSRSDMIITISVLSVWICLYAFFISKALG